MAKFIHGDYDLYDLVGVDEPARRETTESKTDGVPHNYGRFWKDVSANLNKKFNVEMIQHGSQVHFSDHTDEWIDMFTPFSSPYHRLTVELE